MAVVKNLMVRAGADFSQMRTEMQKAQRSAQNFKVGLSRSFSGLKLGLAAVGVAIAATIPVIKNAVKSAMEVEAAMGQLGRTLGANAGEFMKWAETSAASYNLSKGEALKYGATYANLLSNFTNGTAQTTKYTEDLLQTSAAVASATGRSISDVMDRIRSGMLGETDAIEDLGINVNNAMIVSTESFKRFANGKHWSQLSYQTQQQILYFAILEQANRKYGTALADNTATRQGQFVLQLKNIQLSLGQAFLPIYNAVLPALTSLASALSSIMGTIAQFTTALFGAPVKAAAKSTTATSGQSAAVSGLGDAYEEAGKKARGAVAGFDEVNQLADSAGSAGSGSTGPSTPSIPTGNDIMGIGDAAVKVSAKVQEMADKVKAFFANFLSPEQKKRISDALSSLKDSWDGLKKAIGDFMDNPKVQKAAQGFKEWWTENGVNNFTNALQSLKGVLDFVAGIFEEIDGILTGDWQKAWEGAKKVAWGLYDVAAGLVGILFPELGKKMDEFKTHFGTLWPDTKKYIMGKWDDLKTSTGQKWDEIKVYIGEKWNLVKDYVHWDNVKDMLMGKWDTLKTETGAKWDTFKQYVSDKWDLIKGFVKWDNIKSAVMGMWDKVKTETGTWWDGFKTFVSGKWNALANIDFSQVWPAIKAAWETVARETGKIWDGIVDTIKGTINAVIKAINGAIAKINNIKIDIPGFSVAGKKVFDGITIGMPNIPSIPALANGGITNGPTMALIGDNPGGQEVVSPLADLMDMIQSAVGTAVIAASQLGGNRQSGDIVIQLGGKEIARAIAPFQQSESSRLGGSMINTAGAARIVTT